MVFTAAELSQWLDYEKLEVRLKSLAEIAPEAMFALKDLGGNIIAVAKPTDLPEEISSQLYDYLQAESSTSEPSLPPKLEIRTDLDIQGQKVGYVLGLARESGPELVRRVTLATRLISQGLAEQAVNDYELNNLSMELLNRYEELTLLYELGQDLGSIFDVTTICELALERSLHVVAAATAFIALMDDNSKNLVVIAVRGIEHVLGTQIQIEAGRPNTISTAASRAMVEVLGKAGEAWPAEDNILSMPLILPTDQATDYSQFLGVMTIAEKPSGEMFTAGETKILTTIITQIAVAIHNSRLVQALRETERIQQQMEIAARIQQSLLPDRPPELTGVDLAGQCISAANVGGDYYDFFVDEIGRLSIVIADVSGHSIGSALMMAMARSTLRSKIVMGGSLTAVLSDTNTIMLHDLAQAEMFISVFCARYDPTNRRLAFANGGHNPPLVWRAAEQRIIDLDTDGLVLGLLDDVSYQEQVTKLAVGDIVVLYTDGIVEARSPDGAQFGQERLQTLIESFHLLTADRLTEEILAATRQHILDSIQQDDITLVVMKITNEA